MSVQPADSETTEQSSQQIHSAAVEIAELARLDVAPQQFFDHFLARVVAAMAAQGGAVWLGEDQRPLEITSQLNLANVALADRLDDQQAHGRLISRVFHSGEGILAPPYTKFGEEGGANPTPYLLVLCPIRTDHRTHGVVEIFQRTQSELVVQRGYLRFVSQMCELAGEYFKARDLKRLRDREAVWGQLERFTRAAHQNLDVQDTAYAVANESCRLIGCDRVSVVVRRGRRAVLLAVSGQDMIEKRSNVAILLQQLAEQVMAAGEPLWYVGETADLPPQIESVLSAYVDESHTRMLGVVPLVRQPPVDPDPERAAEESPEVLGALIIERIDQGRLTDSLRERTDLVCEHATIALANALTYEHVFLMPFWRTIAKSKWLVQARRLPISISVGVALLLGLLSLFVIPAELRITAHGTLQPAERRDVFVQEAGVVDSLLVQHGQQVKKDQELARLRSRELDVSITEIRGRKAATFKQIGSTQQARGDSKISYDERRRLSGQLEQLQETYDSLSEQLTLLLARKEMLTLHSPIDGQVVSWDLQHRLQDRPVEKGALLMSVSDPSQKWELELLVPEDQMGYIARSHDESGLVDRRQSIAAAAGAAVGGSGTNPPPEDVSYIIATDPTSSHRGTVVEIQSSAEVRGEEGNTVLVRVAIDRGRLNPADLRPGAAVTGRIDCGRRSLGFVWFHDLFAFIRSKILFRL
ncbi:MAG: HlyD family efflux transporter periplasmic adaptor subunit [Planctomycetia bacterium]|nr:HlyD family efflux transporter periplasmic adaptor subunit [Planctomycetia bacterium]